MKTQAAVIFGEGKDWEIVELDLDPPKEEEVLVRFAHSGLCHSDEHIRFGSAGRFPLVGGHEGAGIVEEVGPGVRDLKVGDHVVTSFVPACGRCPMCMTGHPYICDLGATLTAGTLPDGSYRFHYGNDELGGFCLLGTFAERSVVRASSVVRIDPDVPLDVASLLGCGVPTGWGSSVNAAKIRPGETVAIFGIGGVGSFAVQGAVAAGAGLLVCVDPQETKLAFARSLGDQVVGVTSAEEAASVIREATRGLMADKVIVTAGVVTAEIVRAAFDVTRKGGRLVVTGMNHNGLAETVKVPGNMLSASAITIRGCLYGLCNPHQDIPKLITAWRRGQPKLGEAISAHYSLEQVTEGYQDLAEGKNIRGLIDHRV